MMSGYKKEQEQDENGRNTRELVSQEAHQTNNSFVWDVNTQLYYHSNTGFYHDPQAGWYYSSRDGLYYKFENGNYVLLEPDQGDESQSNCNAIQDEHCEYVNIHAEEELASVGELYSKAAGTISNGNSEAYHTGGVGNELPGNPPPSEWLEDTLIDLYLSNYPNHSMHVESNDLDGSNVSATGNDDIYELEEGEWIPDDHLVSSCSNANLLDEGTSLEEEHWQAQFGQVTRPDEDSLSNIQAINLWDWSLVKGSRKEKKHKVTRLVGRLVKSSAKLHPSMPSSGSLLRTAPVCEAHLDLVQVKSGKVYRLRNPSSQYLASVSTYDSSNPTKDWGFPQMLMYGLVRADTSGQGYESRGLVSQKDFSLPCDHNSAFEKTRGHVYRDRAAERRALHNGIGVGPGQKNTFDSPDSGPSTSTSAGGAEAMAESLNTSFGAGSYARRILESMGWKEGEALGSSNKGLIEPLQATRRTGNAGLGWNQSRGKYSL
nr:uncharacterized protein LOC109149635 isoform X2 [Ipomoea batatas]GMC52709.1 uncharacterized protein LOC109149635 isoform X2 [Ipomoea batatas]